MIDEKLIRGISRWDLTAIAINTIIGTGIFLLPAKVTGLIGNYSLFAFIACAVIVAFIVLCFAEVSSRFQATGGMYLYAREAFGSLIGFEVGWLYWIVRITTIATNCNALLLYVGLFQPDFSAGLLARFDCHSGYSAHHGRQFYRRSRIGDYDEHFHGRKNRAAVCFRARRRVFYPARQFHFRRGARIREIFRGDFDFDLRFCRFRSGGHSGGRNKRAAPQNVPFALLAALVFCALLFMLIQIVAIGTLPELAASKTPLADAAGQFMGTFGAVLSPSARSFRCSEI